MRAAVAITATILLASPLAAFAHSEADAYQCESNDWDKRIAACTRIMKGRGESKDDRTKALINRGVAYAAKGDYVRAIADYNSSIRLDAKDALAYSGRGNAKRQKPDIDGAIADYSKAIALRLSANSGWPASVISRWCTPIGAGSIRRRAILRAPLPTPMRRSRATRAMLWPLAFAAAPIFMTVISPRRWPISIGRARAI